jgi:hypothetical protein
MDVTKSMLKEADEWFHADVESIREAIAKGFDLDDPDISFQDAHDWTTIHECAGLSNPKGRAPRGQKLIARNVPFDPESATDDEIFDAVQGRKLIWINSIGGVEESARVPAEDARSKNTEKLCARQTYIDYTSAGRRVLSFVDAAGVNSTGYRSVGIDAIIRIAR